MNGFGFIEYKDALDARDVVPGEFHTLAVFNTLNLLTWHKLSVSPLFLRNSSFPMSRDINPFAQMERHC
jgi:hypothetical protein